MEWGEARDAARRSIRRELLFRRRYGEGADLGGELNGTETRASASPVLGRQLEIPFAGPVGQDAEEVAQVRLGVEAVQACRGDEREEVPGALAMRVAADKEPAASPDGNSAQFALRAIILEDETPVVEHAHERLLLAHDIAERGANDASHLQHALVLDFGPREERLHMWAQMLTPQTQDHLGRRATPGVFQIEEAADTRQSFAPDFALGRGRLPEASSCMRPASDFLAHVDLDVVFQ